MSADLRMALPAALGGGWTAVNPYAHHLQISGARGDPAVPALDSSVVYNSCGGTIPAPPVHAPGACTPSGIYPV